MIDNNPANMSNEDLEKDAADLTIDESDEVENHSTAAEGDELKDHLKDGEEEAADTSEGNLPDSESISDNEDGEYDREKIKDK